jgi:hypothetical protein
MAETQQQREERHRDLNEQQSQDPASALPQSEGEKRPKKVKTAVWSYHDIDETRWPQKEGGLPEVPISTEDLKDPRMAVLVMRMPEADEARRAIIIRLNNLRALGARPHPFGWVDKARMRLSISRYQSNEQRRLYRQKYGDRPEVKQKRKQAAADPIALQKKKLYNSRPETKQRRKQIQFVKRYLYRKIKESEDFPALLQDPSKINLLNIALQARDAPSSYNSADSDSEQSDSMDVVKE